MTSTTLHDVLSRFDAAFTAFSEELRPFPALRSAALARTAGVSRLLHHKLLACPEAAECLVVAIAGGTNSGKSTLFNLLVGREASQAVHTAAATRYPVFAGNHYRAGQCLDGFLLPGFAPARLESASAVTGEDYEGDTLFVAEAADFPDHLAVIDTPDIDSIDQANWDVAARVLAASDVVLAVITPEQYKDERVVSFFRRAREGGRLVCPVMNKAANSSGGVVVREQLTDFARQSGCGPPWFTLSIFGGAPPVDRREVRAFGGHAGLWDHLLELNAPETKADVQANALTQFKTGVRTFLDDAGQMRAALHYVIADVEARADVFVRRFEPVPGPAIGGLFHEFVQRKRGRVRRAIGRTSTAVVRGAAAVGRGVGRRLGYRRSAGGGAAEEQAAAIRANHWEKVACISRELAASVADTGQALEGPAGALLREGLKDMELETAVHGVASETIQADDISAAFREHAERTLEAWWNAHPARRRAIEGLDTFLAVTPAAIGLPLSVYTAGIGVFEAVAVGGPVVEQFAARVFEYQFGDRLFDFLSPWRAEQQAIFRAALEAHLVGPLLTPARNALAVLEGEAVNIMEEAAAQCPTD